VPVYAIVSPSLGVIAEWMAWLPQDITRLLNERVQRFLFASESSSSSDVVAKDQSDQGPSKQETQSDSYIHIHGHYIIRPRPHAPDELEIEITARVRVGPSTHPEVVAQSTVFRLPGAEGRKELDRSTYDDLLEQVYSAIVTEVYRQLKDDVQRKIVLLPTNRFRIIALLREGEDYARSNTLRAFEEAQELYWRAAGMSDPTWREPPKAGLVRRIWLARCAIHLKCAAFRRLLSRISPRVAELDVLGARALIGYARMRLFRRPLASLAGKSSNPIFDTRPIVERALACLMSLGRDVPGCAQNLYEAQVTLALVLYSLGDFVAARNVLEQARGSDPQRAEDEPVFLYARSLVTSHRVTKMGLLRRAVELSPRFEVAQFELALEMERQWRSRARLRDEFEENVADLVLQEYHKLLQINPGNIAGWANSGYIAWLLGSKNRMQQALEYYEQGLRFKELKQELFVSELDYGLVRIYAERGDFVKAYEHYESAVSALLSREVDLADFRDYFFGPMALATRMRFERYYTQLVWHFRKQLYKDLVLRCKSSRQHVRIRASIHAFVLNDLGEAYSAFFGEKGKAVKAWLAAFRCNPEYVLPCHNLGVWGAGLGGAETSCSISRASLTSNRAGLEDASRSPCITRVQTRTY
jgi:tetratricopeptide (TPR) repeat protein